MRRRRWGSLVVAGGWQVTVGRLPGLPACSRSGRSCARSARGCDLPHCGRNAVLLLPRRSTRLGACGHAAGTYCPAVRPASGSTQQQQQDCKGQGEYGAVPHPKRRDRKVATASVDSACRLRFLAAAAAATMSAADSDGDDGGWAGGWAACGSTVSTRCSGALRATTARRAGVGSAQRPAQDNQRPCESSGPFCTQTLALSFFKSLVNQELTIAGVGLATSALERLKGRHAERG